MKNILTISNLAIDFSSDGSSIRAVKNISLSLEKGKTLGVVGESGSGKSVTSLAIMGLLQSPPGIIAEGEIWFDSEKGNVDLLKLSEKEKRKLRGNEIAMIFQEPMTSLNPVFTCGNQVVEAIRQHNKFSRKKAKERCIELFEEVQLPRSDKIFKSYPHEISGGQKQRVMIAMAMSCNPSLLIADEPTTALDVTVQKSIIELMKKLQEKYGMSIIFITHDLGVIAEIADSIAIMYKGDIVETGGTQEVFKAPKHPYTKGLMACRPPMDVRPERLSVIKDFLSDDGTPKERTHIHIETSDERKQRHEELYKNTPLIEVSHLKNWFTIESKLFSKQKQYVKAVDDVSFCVYPGETLGLVGESGCGKTTLGRTLLQLLKSTDGSVQYRGRNLKKLSGRELRKLRKKVQIIFQDPYSSLNPRFTVGEAIIEPMKVHGILDNAAQRKDKAIEILLKTGLEVSHFNRYPHEFSGGQRQRICIARALVLNPEFIVCDESVSALDVSVQAQVLNLINKLKEEFNFTYVFISHDLSVVKYMSDRIIVMKEGKIVEIGDADTIYESPETEYTKQLINAIPKNL